MALTLAPTVGTIAVAPAVELALFRRPLHADSGSAALPTVVGSAVNCSITAALLLPWRVNLPALASAAATVLAWVWAMLPKPRSVPVTVKEARTFAFAAMLPLVCAWAGIARSAATVSPSTSEREVRMDPS